MRVMHIVSGRLYGGVETLLVTLARCRELCPAMDPEFALCFDGRLREELSASGVAIHLLGEVRARNPLSVLRARRSLREVLNARGVDLAICHLPWTNAILGPSVRSAGIPLIFWMHGVMNRLTWLDRWAAMTPPDAVICNSKYTANSLPAIFPRVPSKVIYLPVAPPARDRSAQDRLDIRREFDTLADAIVIVQVGRIERLKGHLVHLTALSQLREVPNWIAWFVGGAQRLAEVAYEAELKSAASALGIADRIRFVGERSDVAKILAASDILCQPNIAPEGFGITFIEALYAGLPVVTSALGGSLEIVDSSCGIMVPPRKPEAVADALEKLIGDRDLRLRLGAAGPARAKQLTDPAVQMSQLRSLLGELSDRVEDDRGNALARTDNKLPTDINLKPPASKARWRKLENDMQRLAFRFSTIRHLGCRADPHGDQKCFPQCCWRVAISSSGKPSGSYSRRPLVSLYNAVPA